MSIEFTADTDFTQITMTNLKKFLKERNLPLSGNKTNVILRIKEVLIEEAKVESDADAAADVEMKASDAVAVAKKVSETAVVNGKDSKVVATPTAEADVEAASAAASKPTEVTVNNEVSSESAVAMQAAVDILDARPVSETPEITPPPTKKSKRIGNGLVIEKPADGELEQSLLDDDMFVQAKVNTRRANTSGEITDRGAKKGKKNITPIVFDVSGTDTKSTKKESNVVAEDAVTTGSENKATPPAVTTAAAQIEENTSAETDDKPMKDLTQEEKLARRASKYGLPSTPVDKKTARAKRFSIKGSGDAVASPKQDNSDVIKKRAERFGTVTNTSLKKTKELEALEKRKERFNAVDPDVKAKLEKRAKRFNNEA